jgi:hypothetical protein
MKPRERLLSLIQRHECLDTFWLTAAAFRDLFSELSPTASW